jgi:hypothetical protein
VAAERLGGSLFGRPLDPLRLSSGATWDLFSSRFSEIRAGASWQVFTPLDLEASYLYLRPTFDADSIFNVFSTRPIEEVSSLVTVRPAPWLRLHAGPLARFYSDDADAPEIDATGAKADIGGRGGARVLFGRRGRVQADASHSGGQGGRETVIDLSGDYGWLGRAVMADARATTIFIADMFRPGLAGTMVGLSAGVSYRVRDMAGLHLTIEDNRGPVELRQTRVMAVVDFGAWM